MQGSVISILIILFSCGTADCCYPATLSETFYLSATGSGLRTGSSKGDALAPADFNDVGRWANPKRSGKIGPGDCVYLVGDAGPITEQLTVRASGLSRAPITIAGLSGSDVVISTAASTYGILIENKSYINLSNFTVRGAAFYGKHYPGAPGAQADNVKLLATGGKSLHHVNLTNIVSEYAGRWGFEVASGTGVAEDCDYVTFRNCTARYNTQHGFHVSQNIPPSSYGVHYWYCKSHGNGGYGEGPNFTAHGFACYGGSYRNRCENVHYHYCEAYKNRWTPISHSEGFGWLVDSYSRSVTVDGCYSHDNDGDGFQSGFGSQDINFRYCLAANNGKNGFSATGDPAFPLTQRTSFHNCTSANNYLAGFFASGYTRGTSAVNCIAANNSGWGFASMAATVDASVSYSYAFRNGRGIAGNWRAAETVATDTDPLFRNSSGSYSSKFDFDLKPESPARRAGDTGLWVGERNVADFAEVSVTDARGNVIGAVDIGAF